MNIERSEIEPYLDEEFYDQDGQEAEFDDSNSRFTNFIGEITINSIKIMPIIYAAELVDNRLLGDQLPYVANVALAGIGLIVSNINKKAKKFYE